MGTTIRTIGNPIITTAVEDTDLDVTVQTAVSGGCTLRQVILDNTDGSVEVYLHLWDKASAPTLGTDLADFLFPCPAGRRLEFNLDDADGNTGLAIANNLYFCASAGKDVSTAITGTAPFGGIYTS